LENKSLQTFILRFCQRIEKVLVKALRPIIFDEKVESVSVLSVCQSS